MRAFVASEVYFWRRCSCTGVRLFTFGADFLVAPFDGSISSSCELLGFREVVSGRVDIVGGGVLAALAVVDSIIEDGLLKTGLLLGPTITETLLLRSIALLDEFPRFQSRNHVHDSPVGS